MNQTEALDNVLDLRRAHTEFAGDLNQLSAADLLPSIGFEGQNKISAIERADALFLGQLRQTQKLGQLFAHSLAVHLLHLLELFVRYQPEVH